MTPGPPISTSSVTTASNDLSQPARPCGHWCGLRVGGGALCFNAGGQGQKSRIRFVSLVLCGCTLKFWRRMELCAAPRRSQCTLPNTSHTSHKERKSCPRLASWLDECAATSSHVVVLGSRAGFSRAQYGCEQDLEEEGEAFPTTTLGSQMRPYRPP